MRPVLVIGFVKRETGPIIKGRGGKPLLTMRHVLLERVYGISDRRAGDKKPGAVDFRFPIEMKTTGNSMGVDSYSFQKSADFSNTRSRLGD